MGLAELARGLIAIWHQDRIAFVATIGILLTQGYFFLRVRRRTWVPLAKETAVLQTIAEAVTKEDLDAIEAAAQRSGRALKRILDELLERAAAGGAKARLVPELALDKHRLLPGTYNARLDAAAPGLFTAFGITGTFVGLVFGFLRVEPSNPTQSVAPLMGGMVVAFFNSLIGVGLSVYWSYQSRLRRHEFDKACSILVDAVSQAVPSECFEDQLLGSVGAVSNTVATLEAALREDLRGVREAVATLQTKLSGGIGALTTKVDGLRESTDKSSQALLNQLSTQLSATLRTLVSTPFDELNASVRTFERIVHQTTEQQAIVREQLESAARHVVAANEGLAGAVTEAKRFVDEFSGASDKLRENANAVSSVVAKVGEAGSALGSVSDSIRTTADRYSTATHELAVALGEVRSMSESLQVSAHSFAGSTATLEGAITTLRGASDETVEASVHAVQHELQRTMATVLDGLREVGNQTIAAYESSSERVSDAVDVKMSDLTDRLSAELTTLASRLPSEVEGLNQSMNQIRIQITKATRSMDDAVQQLAHRTPEALRAQLDAYDAALAKAMDRFSGTLLQWDGKISAIETFAAQMQKSTIDDRRLTVLPTPVGGAA